MNEWLAVNEFRRRERNEERKEETEKKGREKMKEWEERSTKR